VLPDAVFADRANGRYDLQADSPLRKLGRQVPLELKSVYKPGRRCWEATSLGDAPDPKTAKALFEVGGKRGPAVVPASTFDVDMAGSHYRAQPEPAPLMMFDPDKMAPADPGPNRRWTETGKYPRFEGGPK
jgi:hypothetical protein